MGKPQPPKGARLQVAFSLWSPARAWQEMNDGRESAYFESEEQARTAAALLRAEDEQASFIIRSMDTPARTPAELVQFLWHISQDWSSVGRVIATHEGDTDEQGNLPGNNPAPIEER